MAHTPIEAHKRRQPDGTLPDISIYPEGAHHPMPSFAHEQALHVIGNVLISLLSPASLVAVELAVLYNPANFRRHLVPDLLVALGAGELDPVYGVLRRQYRIWDEGRPPDLVIEAASPTTLGRNDVGKREDYAAMGVREYVQFDPLEELFTPGLRVYHLRDGTYERRAPGPSGGIPSSVLPDYEWVQIDRWLRLRERATGQLVPTPEEARAAEAARADAAEAARDREAARAAAAEAARAEEATRAEAAEAELARLRTLLAHLQQETADHPEAEEPHGDSSPH